MAKSSKYKDVAMQAVGVTGGFIAANFAGKLVDKITAIPANILPYAKGGLQAIAGVVIASKFGKNKLVEAAGIGMAAKGVSTVIGQFIPTAISGMPGASLINGVAMRYDIDAVTPSSAGNAPFNGAAATIAGLDDSKKDGHF